MTSTSRISFVALDLDGTTLNSSSALSVPTQLTLRKLSSAGVTIAILTGRSMPAVYPHVKTLSLPQCVPVVSYNGCCGYSLRATSGGEVEKETTFFETGLTKANAHAAICFAKEHGYLVQYYCRQSGTIYALNHSGSDNHDSLLAQYSGLTQQKQARKDFRTDGQFLEAELDAFLDQVACAKILLLDNDINTMIERAGSALAMDQFSIIRGSPHAFFVEFLPAGVTKGDGMVNLCKALDVSLESVVAFGDGENDVEFLKYAGIGVAVKNARQVTKESADIVLDRSNDEDAVSLHLESMFAAGVLVASQHIE